MTLEEKFESMLKENNIIETLPDNTSLPLIGEAEAMYFKLMRNFFETSLSHRIMKTK